MKRGQHHAGGYNTEPWGRSHSGTSLPSVGNRLSSVFLALDEDSDLNSHSFVDLRPAAPRVSGGSNASGSSGGSSGSSSGAGMHHLTLNTRDILRQFHQQQERVQMSETL